MENRLDDFFTKKFETDINKCILEKNYIFPQEKMLEYVREVINTDILKYFDWLASHFTCSVLSINDAVQFSSFEDATKRIVEKMIRAGDEGYSHIQIGKFLQDDGSWRTDGAYTKYGENHAKTASYLGLLFALNKCYYVSSVGYMLDSLTKDQQEKLIARMFVRTNLFKSIFYLSMNGKVCLRELFDFISEATYVRRRSNIKKLFQELENVEIRSTSIINKIIF